MKIRVGNTTFNNVIYTDDLKTIRFVVTADMIEGDIKSLIEKVLTLGSFEVLDDDDVLLSTIKGVFTKPYVVVDSLGKKIVFNKQTKEEKNLEMLARPLSIVFVQMAQDGTLDDITISEHPDMFPEWSENWTGKAGTILREGDKLYRSIHDITNIAQNTRPSETPSMWTLVADPTEEYPAWSQPMGAFDTYNNGDKVSYNDKKWVSTVDNNVWEPGVYGWEEVTE